MVCVGREVCSRVLGHVQYAYPIRARIFQISNVPQALQIVWPLSSLLHSGVTVVPQFWQVGIAADCAPVIVPGVVLLATATAFLGDVCSAACEADMASCWVLEIRLLYAGQPLQPA